MYQQLQDIIHSGFMASLGRSLAGSLWFGLIAALAAAVIIISTRGLSSKRRYNLLLILFAAFVVLSVVSVVCSSPLFRIRFFRAGNKLFGDNIYLDKAAGFSETWADFIGRNYGLFGLTWILTSMVLFCRWALRYAAIRRFKANASVNPVQGWDKEIAGFSSRLHLGKVPGIYVSHRIEVPILIGHSDPAIFLPRSMLETLSGKEIEVILLHELAHAGRKDYLVNLCQTIPAILFWFNPAVWWISRLLKQERENCCDDLVLNCTEKPVDYVRTLIKFEEFRLNRYEGAMSLTAGNGGTFKRINRILSGKNDGLGPRTSFSLGGLLLVAALYSVTTTYYLPASSREDPTANSEIESAAKHRAEAADLLRKHQ